MFSVFLLISVISVPVTAQAGFLSFFMEMFNINRSESIAYESNSQTMPLLQAALNYDPDPSKGGGGITVINGSALLPDSGPSGTLANIEESDVSSDRISVYVVRDGDSLSQIAKMFNVSTNTIIWGNDIKRGSLITPGQTLVILPITGIKHSVKKGETIASLAKTYKGDVEEILQYNDLPDSAVLAVGDVVIIPGGEIEAPKYTSTRSVVRGTNVPSYSGYYVRPVSGGRKSQGLHGYNGVDLAATLGTPIVASATGDVIISRSAGWNGGYGKYIVISHGNGTQTLYAHNLQNIVYQGQHVVKGQVIGYIGSTGNSTGPHVHFEIRGAKNPF